MGEGADVPAVAVCVGAAATVCVADGGVEGSGEAVGLRVAVLVTTVAVELGGGGVPDGGGEELAVGVRAVGGIAVALAFRDGLGDGMRLLVGVGASALGIGVGVDVAGGSVAAGVEGTVGVAIAPAPPQKPPEKE